MSTDVVILRLYIAGDSPNSALARANLAEIGRSRPSLQHRVEIVDVFREPDRALEDGVFLTPMLIIVSETATKRIVGTLSDAGAIHQVLGPKEGTA